MNPDAYTFLGVPIWLDHPERTAINSIDIACTLTRICRYNGARPVSVLTHTALVWELAASGGGEPADVQLLADFALLHDAHEAYVGDLGRGWKRLVPDIRIIEVRWAAHVHQSHGLGLPEPEIAEPLKGLDRQALWIEMAQTGHPAAACVADELNRANRITADEMLLWTRATSRSPSWLDQKLVELAQGWRSESA